MTTLVAIMNPQAVALAADSAVTVVFRDQSKIFQSDNKIFALSETAPVGIMTYGNAEFMKIPLDTLIKEYRCRLGDQTFEELEDYAEDFCRFLAENVREELLDEEYQMEYAEELVRSIFEEIKEGIGEVIAEAPYDWLSEQMVEEEIDPNILYEVVERFVIEDVVGRYYKEARDAEIVEDAPAGFDKQIETMLRPKLKGIRDSVFKRALDRRAISKLNYIAKKSVVALFDDVSARPGGRSDHGVWGKGSVSRHHRN